MPYLSLQDYVKTVNSGYVVALPTDTVWGLAIAPDYSKTLYQLKQRSLEKSLILMGASAAELWPYVRLEATQWQEITARYWPGQLTLVVPASPKVPLAMHPRTPDTIGVRVPDHPVARRVLAETGPLATTSANVSGQPTLVSVAQVLDQFPQVYALNNSAIEEVLDKNLTMPVPSGQPSTIVRWQSNDWKILRQGTVYL